MKKFITLILLLVSLHVVAQEKIPVTEADYGNNSIEMADRMRADGKIYVLVGIIGIIFTGITVYLVSTERKIAKIEKTISTQK
ncbi:MAG: CcmD family protein [Algoriphagus sp.]|uniref:CcmD family protein n=1 Tax=Algoriphagus sp. TaxID=1872435 RepID=UPI00185E2387|nr:CcmD family protein [Algoriphagus sp.]NVJ86545.1 CcmD family protein [Algoriphagus sp.]